MTRSWKMFGLPMVLAAALAANPVPAKADDTPDLKEIGRSLKNIEAAMAKILEAADIVKTEGLRIKVLVAKINGLEEKVAQLQNQLDALKKGPPRERVSAYPPEAMDDIVKRLEQIERILAERLGATARVAKAPPEVGRILLINRHPEEMLFIVNNESYRVAPGATAVLDGRPAGVFTYEVVSPTWGQRARKTNTLRADETYRIIVE